MGDMEGLDVTACERCPALVESRSRIVNGVGPADADLVFVGEAPGEQEDQQQVREALAANPVPLLIPDHRVRDGPSGAPPEVEQRLRSLEGL